MSYPPAGRGRHRPQRPDRHAPARPDAQQTEVFERLPARDPTVEPIRYANDLFWIMFDDRTHRLICQRHVAGLGLAAAMLVEVAVGGWVTIEDSVLRMRSHLVPPRDAPTHVLLERIHSEPNPLPVRQWLEYLGQDALDRIIERLERAQVLVRRERPRLLRSPSVTYMPVDTNDAAWPRARLSTFVRNGQALGPFDRVLTGLCGATGLLPMVLEHVPDGDRTDLLQGIDRYLWRTHPSTWEIVHDLHDAVTASTAALA